MCLGCKMISRLMYTQIHIEYDGNGAMTSREETLTKMFVCNPQGVSEQHYSTEEDCDYRRFARPLYMDEILYTPI